VTSTRKGRSVRVTCFLLAVAGLLLGASPGFAQGSIKIGMLAPLSGPFAQIGKDMVAGLKRYYKGRIVEEIYTKFQQQDYQAEISQLRSKNPKAVFVFYPGGMGIQFVKQYEEAGLKGKLPLLGGGTITDETVLPQMGDEAIGLITALHYSQALDNPSNTKFNKAFEASAGKIASYCRHSLPSVAFQSIFALMP